MALNRWESWRQRHEEQRREFEALRTGTPRHRRRYPRRRNGASPEPATPIPNRCPRPDCGGSLIDVGDGATCLLCGRGPDGKSGISDGELERWALSGLMATPPAPVVSWRAGPAEAMGISAHGQPRERTDLTSSNDLTK